jgi:hypothetical protein
MSTKEFTRRIFQWLAQVKNDREMPNSRALFAVQLIEHFNEGHDGAGWASCKTVAQGMGASQATVITLFHLFERRGHLKVDWGTQGSGHSNRYSMIIKKGQPTDLSGGKKHRPADLSETKKGQPTEKKGQPTNLTLLKNHGAASKAAPMERDVALRATDPPGALAPYGGAPEDEKSEQLFAELWALWARPWLDDEAEGWKAFIKATGAGADPADILAGAQTWTAAVEPRFRKPLVKWLHGRGWEKPPPQRRERKGGKPALTPMFIRLGRL